MISANPYQAPTVSEVSNVSPISPYDREEARAAEISAAIIAPLRRTRPWARITSVFFYLMGALLTAAGMYLMVSGTSTKGSPWWSSSIAAVFGVLYFFPAIRLGAYAKSIRQLETSGEAATLETALWHQHAFWRFVGVGASIYLGCTILGVVFVVIASMLNR